ncbi:MAG TPA: mucoidy inhibitor MuiA family protein [Opitutaceae bacterium]
MNPHHLFTVASKLAFALGRSALAAAPIPADSSITKAIVYEDRAIITREARVELATGSHEVLFAALPGSLNPDLLHVSGSGIATASILDVRAVSTQLGSVANPRLAALVEQARAIQAELRTLNDRSTAIQEQRDFLDRIKAVSVTPPTVEGVGLPKIGEWLQLVEFYSQGLSRAMGEQQDIDRQREDVQSRLAATQREISELQAPGQRSVQHVTVRLDVAEAGEMDLKLAYTVEGASWSPSYDVRVNSTDKSIALGYAAMVRQSTGEDWPAVQLVLSTARPALGGTPPELSPWYVGEASPRAPMPAATMADEVELAPFAVKSEADKAFAGGAARARRELQTTSAAVEAGLTAATFTIPYPADVPSDNAPHKVAIATYPLMGELSHVAVPKLAEFAYLRAAVTNTSSFPLISGPVNLFLDGTYVARSHLKTVMPKEKFDLDLGVDSSISVERKLVNRMQENTGIITRNKRIIYDWLIAIQNNSQAAQKLVVQDQLPISQHEKINVKLLAPPTTEIQKDEDGLITWKLDLQPAEKRELPLKISIEYPTDFPISGVE